MTQKLLHHEVLLQLKDTEEQKLGKKQEALLLQQQAAN